MKLVDLKEIIKEIFSLIKTRKQKFFLDNKVNLENKTSKIDIGSELKPIGELFIPDKLKDSFQLKKIIQKKAKKNNPRSPLPSSFSCWGVGIREDWRESFVDNSFVPASRRQFGLSPSVDIFPLFTVAIFQLLNFKGLSFITPEKEDIDCYTSDFFHLEIKLHIPLRCNKLDNFWCTLLFYDTYLRTNDFLDPQSLIHGIAPGYMNLGSR